MKLTARPKVMENLKGSSEKSWKVVKFEELKRVRTLIDKLNKHLTHFPYDYFKRKLMSRMSRDYIFTSYHLFVFQGVCCWQSCWSCKRSSFLPMGGENGCWFQSTLCNVVTLKEDPCMKGRTKGRTKLWFITTS